MCPALAGGGGHKPWRAAAAPRGHLMPCSPTGTSPTWHWGQRSPAAHFGPSSEQPGGSCALLSSPASVTPPLLSRHPAQTPDSLGKKAVSFSMSKFPSPSPGTGQHPLPSALFSRAQAARSCAPSSSSRPSDWQRRHLLPALQRWVLLVVAGQQHCRYGWDDLDLQSEDVDF